MKYYFLIFLLLIVICSVLIYNKQIKETFDEGTYKKLPFNFNSLALKESKDFGVLKNVRPVMEANTYSLEINYDTFNMLLENLKNEKIPYFKNTTESKLESIVKQINILFFKFKLNNEYHLDDTRIYKIIDFEKIISNKISDSKAQLVFNITLYKKQKDLSYNIQIGFEDFIKNKQLKVIKTDIIGINLNQNHLFKNSLDEQKYCILNSDENSNLIKCHEDDLLTLEDKKFFYNNLKLNLNNTNKFQTKKEKEFLKEKKEEAQKHKDYSTYKCFGKEGFNESTCNSHSFLLNQKGVWDNPCKKNEECPFYKKNLNYKNSRGGCINGYCELPLNLKRQGYKKYDINSKPFCHNCKIDNCKGEDCFTCCTEQSVDKKKYNLKSPDYIFFNDLLER